ncbi:lysozyme [Pseudomonas sp. S5(2021)]|nr:lysozyme [Pseudomonas sp. S5(2021)]
MKASQDALDIIKKFEGFSEKAYPDPAHGWRVPTIGYGTTRGVKMGQEISKERAEELLREDVARFDGYIEALVRVPLTQGQWDALSSFVYNLGPGALEKSTLLRLLNAGDYSGAAAQFDRWVYASGKKLTGLVKRRAAERALFEGKTPCA